MGTMFHANLTYCINIYTCANTTNLQRRRVKQKEAIQVMNNAGYRDAQPTLLEPHKLVL
jgi:hypothetical protein